MSRNGAIHFQDGIEARVGTYRPEHPRAVIAYHTDVVLLYPTPFGIHHRQVVQEGALVFPCLVGEERLSGKQAGEALFDFPLRVVLGIEVIQAVVGEAASQFGKDRLPSPEGIEQVAVGMDFHPRSFSQATYIYKV